MKLLFDENISYRIIKKMKILFPESKQVSDLQLKGLSDRQIWNFAKTENYSIVTFDADFYDIAALYGHPPKIIWLRMGNTTTQNIENALTHHFLAIKDFLTSDNFNDVGCFEIH